MDSRDAIIEQVRQYNHDHGASLYEESPVLYAKLVVAMCSLITHQKSKKWKELQNHHAQSQLHSQVVKVYHRHEEPRPIHSDIYTYVETE